MKVLWLASWFPNRTNPSNGDFIERHAIATAAFVDRIFIVAVVKDESMKAGTTEIVKKRSANLDVYTVYYGKSKWAVLEKVQSLVKYFLLQKKIYRTIQEEYGDIDIVHVNVPLNAGIFALYLQGVKKIPFVLTEHWGGYAKAAKPNASEMNRLFFGLMKTVIKKAAVFLPVTNDLGRRINENFFQVPYRVIPNVVDTSLFFYRSAAIKTFSFIHPSYMNYPKNPEGILEACKLAKDRGLRFKLLMLGKKDEALQAMAGKSGLLNENVFFEDAIPYGEVAGRMQQSGALLLFSRYENLPCVMLEALCCGLPVIATKVGGIAEVIDESNGILVNSADVQQLATAMETMINQHEKYDREKIAAEARKRFNYDVIGKQYLSVYQSVLKQS